MFWLCLSFLFELDSVIWLRSLRSVSTISANVGKACCNLEISSMEFLASVRFWVDSSSLESLESILVLVDYFRVGFPLNAFSRSAIRGSTALACRLHTYSGTSVGCVPGRFGVKALDAARGF